MNANIHRVVSINATPVQINTLESKEVYALRKLEIVDESGHIITLTFFASGGEENDMQEKLRIQL